MLICLSEIIQLTKSAKSQQFQRNLSASVRLLSWNSSQGDWMRANITSSEEKLTPPEQGWLRGKVTLQQQLDLIETKLWEMLHRLFSQHHFSISLGSKGNLNHRITKSCKMHGALGGLQSNNSYSKQCQCRAWTHRPCRPCCSGLHSVASWKMPRMETDKNALSNLRQWWIILMVNFFSI